MVAIAQNLQAVRETIVAAAQAHGRAPGSVALLAVSKTFGPEAVLAAVRAGQRRFGENYLQEALDKMASVQAEMAGSLPGEVLEWHFIGPIQSNKTRQIAENFDWVHTVDRLKVAQRLSEQRPEHLPPLNVCIQVNISGEDSKSGVAPEACLALARAVACTPRLRLRGLMAIPAPADGLEQQRVPYRCLRELADRLRADGLELDTLSMGMSADMEAAIAEGATMVRVGTALFGRRVAAG